MVGVDVSAGNISLNGSADQSVIIPISVARKLLSMTIASAALTKMVYSMRSRMAVLLSTEH